MQLSFNALMHILSSYGFFVLLAFVMYHVLVFLHWFSFLRFQHAPQQQQLVNDGRGNDPRCGCGKTRNSEEMGSQHLQGI